MWSCRVGIQSPGWGQTLRVVRDHTCCITDHGSVRWIPAVLGDAAQERQCQSSSQSVPRQTAELEREVGTVRFVYDSQDHAALRTVMAWKSAQYLRTGTADRFAQRSFVDLSDRLFATTSEPFSGVLSMLYAGDEPVAGHFGLRSDRVMAYWVPAFDRRYGPYFAGSNSEPLPG